MAETFTFTKAGYEALKAELEDLETVQRPDVIHEIEVAKGFGDLSENAEYTAARERQSKIYGRINEIHFMLEHAEIVEVDSASNTINVGYYVRVYDEEFDETDIYKIVGNNEYDFEKLYVSNDSPIGAALIGAKVGDTVDVTTPGGVIKLKILEASTEELK